MTFIAITFSIMAVSIFFVHKVTRHFHYEINYKSLILCALMAFAVSFISVALSPYLNREHYIRLVALSVFAAAIVTFYNERTFYGEGAIMADEKPPEEKCGDDEGEAMGLAFFKGLTKSWKKFRDYLTDSLSGRRGKSTFIPPTDTKRQNTEEKEVVSVEVKTEVKDKAEVKVEVKKEELIPEVDVADVSSEPAMPLLPPAETPPLLAAPGVAEETAAEAPEEASEAPEETPEEASETALEEPPAMRPVNITEALSRLSSLDDILDYAQSCADERDYANAIFAYKRALERYQNDDYAPFIAIELVGVYKENGAYEEAIRALTEAMRLSGIAKNDAVSQEFRKNSVYLRTVQYVLSKHNAPRMPFGAIPAAYFDEIESVFASRRGIESAS